MSLDAKRKPDAVDAQAATELGCPRCGHGIGASCAIARERGDSRVVCTECGFDCEIARLDAGDSGPTWFVESPFSPRSRMRRAIETFLVAHVPHVLWSRVPMSLRLRPGRIALFLLAVAAALHVVCAGIRVVDSLPALGNGMPPEAVVAEVVLDIALPANPYSGADLLGIAIQGDADRAVGIGTIARFVALSFEGMTFKPWLESAVVPTDGTVDSYYGSAGLRMNGGPPMPILAEIIRNRPRMKERGTPVFIDGLQSDGVESDGHESAYAFPIETSARSRMSIPIAIAAGSGYLAIFSIALLALLPITLRRAKVRFAHLLRATAYVPVVVPFLTAVFIAAEKIDAAGVLPLDPMPFVVGTTLAFPLVWLHAVCRCYLRIRHAALTAFLLTILTLLLNVFVVGTLSDVLRGS
jgi:predicted RNA-binding Zn-ribbon protein involved in translation (DUF1610 family)